MRNTSTAGLHRSAYAARSARHSEEKCSANAVMPAVRVNFSQRSVTGPRKYLKPRRGRRQDTPNRRSFPVSDRAYATTCQPGRYCLPAVLGGGIAVSAALVVESG